MPCRRHPAAEFPLPLLASLVAPSPTSGGGEWPPPSLASLPSLPPQAGVGYACPWTSCNGLPITEKLITLRYHGETAHPPPAPRPPFSVRPRSLSERDRPEKRGRPPPRPRGARLPCNTVHTVQPIRKILITLRYPAIQPSAGGRGVGAPISPTPLRSGARPAFTEPL